MDNEMIERCAKALWEDDQSQDYVKYGISNEILFGDQWRGKSIPWEHLLNSEIVIPSVSEQWRNKIRIIIKAIREPTEKMIAAGALFNSNENNLAGYNKAKANAALSFKNMINAIIGEE